MTDKSNSDFQTADLGWSRPFQAGGRQLGRWTRSSPMVPAKTGSTGLAVSTTNSLNSDVFGTARQSVLGHLIGDVNQAALRSVSVLVASVSISLYPHFLKRFIGRTLNEDDGLLIQHAWDIIPIRFARHHICREYQQISAGQIVGNT